jgi:hypothetical protein
MSALHRLTVTDDVDARLSGRAALSYTSPPQSLDELRALLAALLNGGPVPTVGVAVTHAIAGGRGTVHITPATTAPGIARAATAGAAEVVTG